LVQDDPDGAKDVLSPLLARLPKLRPALALFAAAQAITYDEKAMKAALDKYDGLSPGSAPGLLPTVGRHLSLNRQYGAAAAALKRRSAASPRGPLRRSSWV
jgi:hypothetical protein